MKLKNKNGMNIYGFNVKSDNFPGPGLVNFPSLICHMTGPFTLENVC